MCLPSTRKAMSANWSALSIEAKSLDSFEGSKFRYSECMSPNMYLLSHPPNVTMFLGLHEQDAKKIHRKFISKQTSEVVKVEISWFINTDQKFSSELLQFGITTTTREDEWSNYLFHQKATPSKRCKGPNAVLNRVHAFVSKDRVLVENSNR